MALKSSEIDFLIKTVLYDIEDPKDGYTTIQLTKLVYQDEIDEIGPVQFARACNRVSRRMGAIRHEVYDELNKELKSRSEGSGYPRKASLQELFWGPDDDKDKPFDDNDDDLRPDFLPFALPVGATWKYFNAAKHPHIGNIVKNHREKSAGLESRAELLSKIYQVGD